MRVHELAKELDIPSKELIALLTDLDIEVKNHMSGLDEEQVALAREAVAESKGTSAEPDVQQVQAEEDAPAAPAKPEAEKTAESPQPAPVKETPPAPAKEDTEPAKEEEDEGKVIILKGPVVVKELAKRLGQKPNRIITELMRLNVLASINEKVDFKIAQQIAENLGYRVEHPKKGPEPKKQGRKDEEPIATADKPEDLKPRPPIVAFLGHVDHGKTSLLDGIRKTKVVDGESGGITQHIGAYSLTVNGQPITFLDTPGHEAFTAMRARGAQVTDIVIIVVAADEGLMPQTREAIQHAQAAEVSIMVAINKMDLPGANPDRVKQQLQAEGLMPEDWGGDIICTPVCATKGEGLDDLLEMISLQAEVLELQANPKRDAEGVVIEARLEQGMGPTATFLVRRGTLKVGDAVVCGNTWGKIKALVDEEGKRQKKVGPSGAVKVMGLNDVPNAGDKFRVYKNDRAARAESDDRKQEKKEADLVAQSPRMSLEAMFAAEAQEEVPELGLVIKSDVQGSLEAIQHALNTIPSEKARTKIILSGVGNITENDVLLASASDAIVVGFHVAQEPGIARVAKSEGVEIRLYSIIYELVDDIRDAMTGMLNPELREQVLGRAEVKEIFSLSGKKGNVAGCMVISGRVAINARARLIRLNEVVYEGQISSLRRFQDDVSDVRDGQECGMRIDNYRNYEQGDIIEVYKVEQRAQSL